MLCVTALWLVCGNRDFARRYYNVLLYAKKSECTQTHAVRPRETCVRVRACVCVQ